MIDAKYKSENGTVYELHEDGWYHDGKKFPKAVFLSSEGAAVQYDMLIKGTIESEEFFEKDDESDQGYLYYIVKRDGKKTVKHSSKLTEIVEDTLKFKDDNSIPFEDK